MIIIPCITPGCENTILSLRPIDGFKCQECSSDLPAFQGTSFDPKLDRRRTGTDLTKMNAAVGNIRFDKLTRTKGSGFQILIPRTEERDAPMWSRTAAGIRQLLLTAFPKAQTDPKQRVKAGRWAQVIKLYFQLGWSYTDVATELNEKPRTIEMLIRSITRASLGLRADGKGPRRRA